MLVKDIMTKNPIYVTKNDNLKKVLKILSEKRIAGCPVVDSKKKVVGVVSESDIINLIDVHSRIHSPKEEFFTSILFMLKKEKYDFLKTEIEMLYKINVKDFMSKKVVTIDAGEEVYTAARLMNTNDINKLPVVRKERLVGMVTKWDLIRMLEKMG